MSVNPLEIYQREGGAAALQRYMAEIGVNYAEREPGVAMPARSPESAANAEAFCKYALTAVRDYRFDVAALAAQRPKIVLASGSAGRTYVGYRGAVAAAKQLGMTVVEFPSHHTGYTTHLRAFAVRLSEVLGKIEVY